MTQACDKILVLILTGKHEEAEEAAGVLQAEAEAQLVDTHAIHLKLMRAWLKLHLARGDWGQVLQASDKLAANLESILDADSLLCDLRYGYCLIQGARARARLAAEIADREDRGKEAALAHKGGRKALRVYATVLGSSHWFVAQLKAEVQGLAPSV